MIGILITLLFSTNPPTLMDTTRELQARTDQIFQQVLERDAKLNQLQLLIAQTRGTQ